MESKVWLPEDVMDHLAVLIREEIGSKNELKGLDKLEVFSHYLRKHSFKLDDLLTDQHLKDKLALPKKY